MFSPINPDLNYKPCIAPDVMKRIGGWLGRRHRCQAIPELSETDPGPRSSLASGKGNKAASVGGLVLCGVLRSAPSAKLISHPPVGDLGSLANGWVRSTDMPAAGVSSKIVPPVFPRCPTCNEKMVFVSVSPTCQSVIYGYICRNDGDRLSWECLQSHQPKVVGSEMLNSA